MSKNPKIEKMCLYCEYASVKETEGELSILCRGKKSVMPDQRCIRFRYDPLKRVPKPKPRIPTLDPEMIID